MARGIIHEAKLEPGWLAREFRRIDALQRAIDKVLKANARARRNGYTQPVDVTFSISELRELAGYVELFVRSVAHFEGRK